MKKGKNKAFTIIELIIVIAVIGVLTAVTIPVISGMIEKATFVDDVSLARNMTTSLSVSGKDIDSVHTIEATIAETYGDDFVATLTPKTADKGNHFWYNYRERKVEVKTLDEIASSEPYARLDPSFRSCIKDGYALLDHSGSELAGMASLMEEVYTRRECDQILDYFGRESGLASNFVENLNNTLIINENGCLRGANYNQISDVYFSSDTVNLQKTVLFEFGDGAINFKTVSLDTPVAGTGLNGKTIEIKKTMFFGTHTLIFGEGCNAVLHADVNSLDELKSIFGAASTNALIKINNDSHTYRILGDAIIDASSNVIVKRGLTATISDAVLNVAMPSVETVNVSQTVTTAGNVVSEATNISSGAVTATVPEGVAVTGGTLELQVTEKEASEANIVLNNFATSAIDVHIEGVSPDNDVPIVVALGPIMPAELKSSNVRLYHVEDYEPVLMTRVDSLEELTAHNTYVYDFDTGNVTIALKSFSEILRGAGVSTKWDGTANTSWYNGASTEFTLTTPEQLAGLAKIVNEGTDSFQNKTVKLDADIVINDWDLTSSGLTGDNAKYATKHTAKEMATSDKNDPAFVGSQLSDENSCKIRTFTPIGKDTNHTFMGNFDGQNHNVSGLFGLYYNDPMASDYLGLFGCIQGPTGEAAPITISNLTVRDSWYYYYGGLIGLVTSLSYGNVTYDNIKIEENYTSQYNWHSGGVVGFLYANSKATFTDIVIDDTNIFEALWETYDAAVGGLIGCVSLTDEHTPTVNVTDCDIYPVMNVYNDCSSNYLWFAYRRSGMLVGCIKDNGSVDASAFVNEHFNCSNVKVHYGSWSDYYYYKWPVNGNKPSYPDANDWKYRRYRDDQLVKNSAGEVIGDNLFTDENRSSSIVPKVGDVVSARGNTYTLTADDFSPTPVSIPFDILFGGGNYYTGFYQIRTDSGVTTDTSIVTLNVDGETTRLLANNGQDLALTGENGLDKPGYKLYRWSDGSNLYNDSYRVTHDVTLTATWKQRIELIPGVWDKDAAAFGVAAIDSGEHTLWFKMTKNSDLNVYETYVPVTHLAKLIFVRVASSVQENELSWELYDSNKMWNQTEDITNATSHLDYSYQITGWEIGGGNNKSPGQWDNRYVYLKPTSNWAFDGARFAVYYFNSPSDNTWRDMELVDSSAGLYRCEIINGYSSLIFCRMDGGTTENNWDNRWTQSNDLTLGGNKGKTYTINSQDGKNGYWGS